MNDHDPLCPTPTYGYRCPRCDFIAKVRADEQDQMLSRMGVPGGVRTLVLSDLRAKIETLPIWQDSQGWKVVSYADVCTLIDGSRDE